MRVLLLLLCSCGRVAFDPLQGPPALDDSGAEGITGDGTLGTEMTVSANCTAPSDSGSTFPGGLPCANWQGNASFSNAGLSETGGQLQITPNANTAGAQGSCLKNAVPYGTGGAIIEVSAVLNGTAITSIQLGLGGTALSIVQQSGNLLAQDASGDRGSVAYSAAAMRFWRIRPTGNGSIFEYGDGMTWSMLGTSAQPPQATYDIRVIAGEIGGIPNPGTARFESVNLCPP